MLTRRLISIDGPVLVGVTLAVASMFAILPMSSSASDAAQQTAASSPDLSNSQPKNASESAGPQDSVLEEILVTAQKRQENLQKVPISILAFDEKAAQALGITNALDLAEAVPSVQFNQSSLVSDPFIRGVGTSNNTPGDNPASATYIDGVYSTNQTAGFESLSNIERVEVLKGPQGTLFGRNAVGGVINIITKSPSFTPSVDVTAGYANFDTGSISAPLL